MLYSQSMRMGRDSNPRWTFAQSGFQDRRLVHSATHPNTRAPRLPLGPSTT